MYYLHGILARTRKN